MLTSFFPKSDSISFKKFQPTKEQRAALHRELGYELSKSQYYFFVATSKTKSGTVVDGYAFIDDQMGQHKPITFAVKLSTEGVVLREEIMVYRESRGDEVRSPRFSKQFKGKTIDDSLRPNKDIDSVSGATISSRAITVGVRRALVLFDAAITSTQPLRISQAGN
jgi:Na+-translocating ferredoxin:NAD+ oxidoreductase RnfG subunit